MWMLSRGAGQRRSWVKKSKGTPLAEGRVRADEGRSREWSRTRREMSFNRYVPATFYSGLIGVVSSTQEPVLCSGLGVGRRRWRTQEIWLSHGASGYKASGRHIQPSSVQTSSKHAFPKRSLQRFFCSQRLFTPGVSWSEISVSDAGLWMSHLKPSPHLRLTSFDRVAVYFWPFAPVFSWIQYKFKI